jgi:hypothetical protein
MSDNDTPRIILGLAAERDDTFAWDQLKAIQTRMFSAGPLVAKFAYFGREDEEQTHPMISTDWVRDSDDMTNILDRARAACVCGCFTDTADILAEAVKENRRGPVRAVVIVGDNFRDLDEKLVERLRQVGTRLFLFQSAKGPDAALQALAERTGGGYFAFNPNVERIAKRLPSLLEEISHLAIGGVDALRIRDTEAAALLLEQMSAADGQITRSR